LIGYSPEADRLTAEKLFFRRRLALNECMAATVADQLIGQLEQADVRRIYGIVGDSLNPIVDAVRRTGGSAKGGIAWVHVRNEEAAAFAAGADAQLTGEIAVCAGSCGPGNLHLITVSTMPTAAARRFWPSPARSQASKSAASTSRRRTRTASLWAARTTAN
jgi:hypothetical protein